jgi:ABC-2 type transport system ATP-binding protein
VNSGVDVQHLGVIRRGRVVLRDLSLRIEPGELVGLLGPSGSGKSTLMRALVGVQRVTSGSATIDGIPIGSAELRHRVGYVAQTPASYRDLTVEENVRYFAAMLGIDSSDADRVLELVDLSERRRDLVSSLSGGETNRVSLAVALLGEPQLLLLDEPTVGLDPVLREHLWGVFRQLRDRGLALVVSSHVMDEASRCDRLVLLRAGKFIFDGSPSTLLSRTGAGTYDGAFIALVKDTA